MPKHLHKRLPAEIVDMIAMAAVETALEADGDDPEALALELAARGCAEVFLTGGVVAGVIVPKGYLEKAAAPAVARAMRAACSTAFRAGA